MWRSPIQICGTVRRPLFSIISTRRAGSRSTRTRSMSLTPLLASKRSADWQNGHAAVRYISTRATSALHRQAGLLPRGQPPAQVHDAREAEPLQRRRRLRRALAAVAIDDQRLVLALGELRRGGARLDLRQRNAFCTEDVAAAELRAFADVEE